ncbi:MAG: F0F1 ATP synthase subunit A [Burkholderiaceae bacterium]
MKKYYKNIYKIIEIQRKEYKNILIFIFIYILINNILGLLPYIENRNSKIKNTIYITFILIIGLTLKSIYLRGYTFINKFRPKGINKIIGIFIMIIEIFSYILRILTLSLRLTANMIAGHMIIKVISTFILNEYLLIPFIFLEIGISILQAYVFLLLLSSYINEI